MDTTRAKSIAKDMSLVYEALVENGFFHSAALELTSSYFKGGYK